MTAITNILKKTFKYSLFIGILGGIVITICKFFMYRPLWIDEAMLMSNVVSRDITEISNTPLMYGQNSSLGYLYIIKIISILFGTGEYALRLLSLLSWGGVLYLLGKISKDHFKASATTILVICFIFTASGIHMYYAQEAKSYMFECLWILLVIYAFGLRWKENISSISFSLICAVSFFFAYPTCFIIAATYILLFTKLIKQKKKTSLRYKLIKKEFLCSIPLITTTLLLALFWIIPGSKSATDPNYWKLLSFPLFPNNIEELRLIKQMLTLHLLAPIYGKPAIIITIFLIVGSLVYCKEEGNFIVAAIFISCSILLITSSLGYWPIIRRLLIFNFLFYLLIACFIIKSFIKNTDVHSPKQVLIIYISYLLLICISAAPYEQLSTLKDLKKFGLENFKKRGQLYEIFNDFKRNGENHAIYVNRAGLPLYDYMQGYQSGVDDLYSPKVIKGNTLYGARIISFDFETPYSYAGKDKKEIVEETLKWMEQYKRIYLFISHDTDIVPYLEKKGSLKKFSNHSSIFYVYEHS